MAFVLTDRQVATHEHGDINCNSGWCSPDSDGTPVPYPHSCGGIVHGDFESQSEQPPEWKIQIGCDHCSFRETITHAPGQTFTPKEVPEGLKTLAPPAKAAPVKKAAKTVKKKAK